MNILALDDNVLNLEMLESIIIHQNHTPFLADHASNAFEVLKKEKIDLIISDINMPVIDGIQFGLSIRRHGISIPIIYFSGEVLATTTYAKEFLEMGNTIFIEKAGIHNLVSALKRFTSDSAR